MKVVSLNARGLGNRIKRRSVFKFLRKEADIIFLQETHLNSEEKLKIWEAEWGGPIFSSMGTSNSKGTAIMINPSCGPDVYMSQVQCDGAGRLVLGILFLEGKHLVLGNVYAPTIQFFMDMVEIIEKLCERDHDAVILGRDFNLVMNPELDRHQSLINHKESQVVLMEYAERAGLVDVWHIFNPTERRYTWHRWNRQQKRSAASRINFFLITQGLVDRLSCGIDPGHHSDHSLI